MSEDPTTQNIPIDQAKNEITQNEAQYKQSLEVAKQKATNAAQATAKVVSAAAILAFAALLLGAIAAWFSGSIGNGAQLYS